MADEREKLRRAVRRGNAVPSTNILETEVRSQGAPNFKSDADPELQPKVVEVRRRIARLGGIEGR